jgi:hypothetical protein
MAISIFLIFDFIFRNSHSIHRHLPSAIDLELDLVNPPHKEGFLTAVFSWLCIFMFNLTFLEGEQGGINGIERRAAASLFREGDRIAALEIGQDIVVVRRLGVGAGTETLLLKVAEGMDALFLKEDDSTAVLLTTQFVKE